MVAAPHQHSMSVPAPLWGQHPSGEKCRGQQMNMWRSEQKTIRILAAVTLAVTVISKEQTVQQTMQPCSDTWGFWESTVASFWRLSKLVATFLLLKYLALT